jgi:hypothetical protein
LNVAEEGKSMELTSKRALSKPEIFKQKSLDSWSQILRQKNLD